MFKPLPMQFVTLHMLAESAPVVALAVAELGIFAPEKMPDPELPFLAAQRYRTLFHSAETRLAKIIVHCPQTGAARPAWSVRAVTEEELIRLDNWLGELWSRYSEWEEELRRLTEEQRMTDDLMTALIKFLGLDVDLSWFQERRRFLDVQLGTVPLANVQRLTEALGLVGYVLTRFFESRSTVYGVIAGPMSEGMQIDNVLHAAGWQPLALPAEFRGRPEAVRSELLKRRGRIKQEQEELEQKLAQSAEQHQDELCAASRALSWARPYARLGEVLQGRGELALVGGWVPQRDVPKLESALKKRLDLPVAMTARDPVPGESVPSCMLHHRWLRPFANLVKNYGVPRYGELDPTWLFACSFIAMFGMMFGDVGQGSLIAVAGFFFRQRLRGFGPFVVAIGVSSAGFGFLYGSVFGFEEWLPAFWIHPLSDPLRMLRVALYWGVGFIFLATSLTIYNRLREGRVADAFLDGKGAGGLFFYLGLLYACWRWLGEGRLGVGELLSTLLPLTIVIVYRWLNSPLRAGERLLVVLIEGFETVMAYISNTLSFLRVAAFSLNHMALAIAVFTLAEGLKAAGHWATIALGNAFILVLEGAIVLIQVLRLEYYEGFSRFYRGDGWEFRPLTLDEPEGDRSSTPTT